MLLPLRLLLPLVATDALAADAPAATVLLLLPLLLPLLSPPPLPLVLPPTMPSLLLPLVLISDARARVIVFPRLRTHARHVSNFMLLLLLLLLWLTLLLLCSLLSVLLPLLLMCLLLLFLLLPLLLRMSWYCCGCPCC